MGYYQPVFEDLHDHFHDDIERALLAEPRAYRATYWREYADQVFIGDAAWDRLHHYAKDLENSIQRIVAQHSVYYWIHLYRRIGVKLHSGHEHTDPTTVGLVRLITEAAFLRFGQLQEVPEDIRIACDVEPEHVLGGLYCQFFRRRYPPEAADSHIQRLRTSKQWVLTRFSASDLIDVYRVEGFAFEYWRTTAFMRAVGKGSALEVLPDGDPHTMSIPDLRWLMTSYDTRIADMPLRTSAIGVAFGGRGQSGPHVPLAQHNIERRSLRESLLLAVPGIDFVDFVPNFVYGGFDLGAYLAAHDLVDREFSASRGFSLASLSAFVGTIAVDAFAPISRGGIEGYLLLHQLYQRGYLTLPVDGYLESVTKAALEDVATWGHVDASILAHDARAVLEYLTLRPQKQSDVSLWSHGPRFAFIPHGNAIVVDLSGLALVLRNAFFRLKHDQAAKGPAFEDYFRGRAVDAGLQLLPERRLRADTERREVDAAIRVGTTLFLCECKAMEQPLDFEIGRPKTLRTRREAFEIKLQQALSLEEFVRSSLAGRNYNFGWATKVVSIIVSPFVEWIWSRDTALWLTESVPRILSADEAITFMLGSR